MPLNVRSSSRNVIMYHDTDTESVDFHNLRQLARDIERACSAEIIGISETLADM